MSSPVKPEQARPLLSPSRWLERFEEEVQRHPSETAIASGSGSISYSELNERSNRIASQLLSQGIGRGHFIGLGLPRSLDLPVALLGILKAGAGYIPLDPYCPAGRVQELAVSAKLDHVITNESLAAHFPGLRTIFADDSSTGDPTLPFRSRSRDFNSGAGEISPLPFPHHGAVKLLHWYSINLTGTDQRDLIISKPSFDLTRRNFFTTLITGGTLVLEDCRAYDVRRIAELIRRNGAILIQCPTEAFYKLVEAAAATEYIALASLRVTILDGEKASIVRLRPWLDHPNCHVEITRLQGCPENPVAERSHRSRFPEPRHRRPEASEIALTLDRPSKPEAPEILSLWSKILKRPVNDAESNFFEIGGTPIHLAIIHVQLMKMTGKKFPLQELFEAPTANMLARFLAAAADSRAPGHFPPAQAPSQTQELKHANETPGRIGRGYDFFKKTNPPPFCIP